MDWPTARVGFGFAGEGMSVNVDADFLESGLILSRGVFGIRSQVSCYR